MKRNVSLRERASIKKGKILKRPVASTREKSQVRDPFLEQVAKIRHGKLLTFRELTAAAGSQGMGGMMAASAKVHRIPPSTHAGGLAWWRVIFTGDGQVLENLLQCRGGQFGTAERGRIQKRLLEKEGWNVAADVPRKVQILCPDDELTVYGDELRKGKSTISSMFSIPSMERRVSSQPFECLGATSANPLGDGSALRFPLLSSAECQHMLDFLADKQVWDRHVRLDRVNYGKVGIYHYVKEEAYQRKPVGRFISRLRETLYRELMRKLPAAATTLKNGQRCPSSLKGFHDLCKRKPYNQKRPSPLVFYYQRGGECYAHQDIFGSRSIAFPYQALIMLNRPKVDFVGGHFYLKDCETGKQRNFDLQEGDCLIFDVGVLAPSSKVKHGMTKISKGKRAVFGFAFHMAA
jgi:alkylated DNA nucleotide flippase Atl1